MGMVLRSPAFPDLGCIPDRYASERHLSPPLVWWDVPLEARSFALVCDDLDGADGRCFRWALCDIPGQKRAIVEGYPAVARTSYTCQGTNDFGAIGYHGPCAREGVLTHHLRFRLFALRVSTLGLAPGVSCRAIFARAFEASMEVAQLVGARPSRWPAEAGQEQPGSAWDVARHTVAREPREPAAPGRAAS
jgi:Raf kinase inhibitor-like YbhB/YbcL family protein